MAESDFEGSRSEDSSAAIVGDVLMKVVQRVFSRSRNELGRAADRGRRHLEHRQLDKDLDLLYRRLGKETCELLQASEIDHADLREAKKHIDELELRISEFRFHEPGSEV